MKREILRNQQPDDLETRTIVKFAWLPVICTKGNRKYLIWLEKYIAHQTYDGMGGGGWDTDFRECCDENRK